MRWISAVVVCALLLTLVAGGGASAQGGTVVVYSALDAPVTSEVLKAFERASGLKTEALPLGGAGTLATRIRAWELLPQGDIFMGGLEDFHAPLAREGLLDAYASPRLAEAKLAREFYNADGYWYGWYIGALAIMYNRDRFEREMTPQGVKPPAAWDDLLNPAFKGQVVLPSPVTTGGGFIFMATHIFRLGSEDRAFDWLKRLAQNAMFTPTAPAGITLVARGEALVGMNWGHDIRAMAVNQGFPVELVFPAETATELRAVSIVKGGPNPDGAPRFVDFMLRRVPQAINAKYGLRYPTRTDAPAPLGMPGLGTPKFLNYNRQRALGNS